MELNKQQLAKVNELIRQSEAYEHLRNKLRQNILTTWFRFVGQMREYFYMDEQWDGNEITFLSDGKILVMALLENDQITVTSADNENKPKTITAPENVDNVIQTLVANQLPQRNMPADKAIISPGGGRCDLCWHNRQNNEKENRIVDFAMGFAICYGVICADATCEGNGQSCTIHDIGIAIPGLTAEQVTHILFPYWWTKSRFNNVN